MFKFDLDPLSKGAKLDVIKISSSFPRNRKKNK